MRFASVAYMFAFAWAASLLQQVEFMATIIAGSTGGKKKEEAAAEGKAEAEAACNDCRPELYLL